MAARAEPATVTASAKRINLSATAAGLAAQQTGLAAWQEEAWAFYDTVPEVGFAVDFVANGLSKVNWYVGLRDPDDPRATPVPIGEAEGVPAAVVTLAEAQLTRLHSQLNNQAETFKRMAQNIEVAGEFYLVGFGEREPTVNDAGDEVPGTPEEWFVASRSEVVRRNNRWAYIASESDNKGRELEEERDTCIRIWMSHPRWAAKPISPMRQILRDCRVLDVLYERMLGDANSHRSAGILTVANELGLGPKTVVTETGETVTEDEFMADLEAALIDPIEDPAAPGSAMPLVIRGPNDFLGSIRHITLGRSDDEKIEDKIAARLKRCARGLNVPVEVVEGHAATTFSNAQQIDQDAFEDHLDPRCRFLVGALTLAYLLPQLVDADQAIPDELMDRIVVWYDPSALIGEPNAEANAPKAVELGLIGGTAGRRALGFTEDDAPTPEETWMLAAVRKGSWRSAMTQAIMDELYGVALDIPLPVQGEGGAEAAIRAMLSSGRAPAALRAAASDGTGRQLMEIDRDLRTRLLVATSDAMTRALERAGNRMRNANGLRAALDGVPALRAGATVGRDAVTAAGLSEDGLLVGAWDDLGSLWDSWVTVAMAQVLGLAALVVTISPGESAALAAQQATDRATAWTWYAGELDSLASRLMYDPAPAATPGEFDPTLRVPPGLVRAGLARAGGAPAATETGPGVWSVTVGGGTRPAGGVGTGELIRGVFRDHGARTEGYEWVYGPAARNTFEPHLRLDGRQFVNFDDAVLTNAASFPPTAYYHPGDHSGCMCDVAPIIVAPRAAA